MAGCWPWGFCLTFNVVIGATHREEAMKETPKFIYLTPAHDDPSDIVWQNHQPDDGVEYIRHDIVEESFETMRQSAEETRLNALKVIEEYGGIDGGHHKQWLLDQIVRILAGKDYPHWVGEYEDGEDGASTYSWDTGIAP